MLQAVIGAFYADLTYENQGAGYVFKTSDGGSTWTQKAKLYSTTVGSEGDGLGSSVAIHNNTVIYELQLGRKG